MSVILCPTRGGKSSVPNQKWAIQHAKEQGAHLIFLYVSNVRFLDHLSSPLLVDVSHELDEMGEFLLEMARDRALKEGIDAEIMVRHGGFREAVVEVIEEENVDTIVIGKFTAQTGLTTAEYIDLLAEAIRETGVEMLVVDSGELVQRYVSLKVEEDNKTESDTQE